VVIIAAGACSDLRRQQRFAGTGFSSENDEFAIAESARPLVELVDVRIDFQARAFARDRQSFRRRIEVGSASFANIASTAAGRSPASTLTLEFPARKRNGRNLTGSLPMLIGVASIA